MKEFSKWLLFVALTVVLWFSQLGLILLLLKRDPTSPEYGYSLIVAVFTSLEICIIAFSEDSRRQEE